MRNAIKAVISATTTKMPNKGKAKPAILWYANNLPACVDQAEQALLGANLDIYQRGPMLVRPINSVAATVRGYHSLGALTLVPVEATWLSEQLTRIIQWQRMGSKGLEPISAPKAAVDTYLARVGEWKAPVLTGILEAPSLRPDGSILDKAGYDTMTGLLLKPNAAFPTIPPLPSQEDAAKALALLRELIKDFPFAEPHDESVALSAILTALVRRSLRSAPMHAFRAPKMASGKSLLADVVGLIANGRRVAVITPAPDANEERKRVFSVLLAGDSIASVDNVEHTWSSDVMCSVLTQETFQDRILGVSKTATVPTSTFWLCTGNNLTFKGDLTTRVMPCDLDPQTERPEQRAFARNLYEYIPANRGELVRAALTILRAHHLAGRPGMGLKPYGRFEEWSDWVRASLVWLGMPDPCLSITDLEDADPIRQHLRNLLQSWFSVFGNTATTVAEAVAVAGRRFTEEEAMLQDAFEEVAGERGTVNQRILGRFLAKYERRIESGYRIEKKGTKKNAVLWQVLGTHNSPLQPIDSSTQNSERVSSVSFPTPQSKYPFPSPTGSHESTHQTHQTPQTHQATLLPEETSCLH